MLSTALRLTSIVRQSDYRNFASSFKVSSRKLVLGSMPEHGCTSDGGKYVLEVVWDFRFPTGIGEHVVHSPMQLLCFFEEGGKGR